MHGRSLCTALAVLALAGGCKKHHREDHGGAQEVPTQTQLTVISGHTRSVWTAAEFGKVAKAGATNKSGAERDVWSLRDLVHANVGPNARLISVTGASGTQQVDAAAWADPDRTPILHSTRRGTMKFQWADKAGTWLDPATNDVTAIEVAP